MSNILVTGGAGYIGSHTCLQMIAAGFTPIIFDNFSNSKPTVVKRIAAISGQTPQVYQGDIRNRHHLDEVFAQHHIDGVIHFAGLKAVGESMAKPVEYYENNVSGTLTLLQAMQAANVKRIIFSSSATVYGEPESMPIHEDFPTLSATNPYGQSKLMIERILQDLAKAQPDWSITLLRYFNPVGAHPSGTMGEDPQGVPNNLAPYIAQVAVGRREKLSIFGNDYPTVDGSGVRDYIHVMDLADGHVAALTYRLKQAGVHIYNLGTGQGYSVLQVLHAFEQACGHSLAYQICPRRAGDIAECWADSTKAAKELHWQATRSLSQMADDTWRWQSNNPNGYPES
ncbi:UDP-glucose 4-epimerase GalE [Celerinatantimonas yamalensis]|uniref:UDP-glucose 4-epimerase n=1 Tax=Celerinatantimonas yamalensis TaxID=559956 RepID=A0ABW9G6M9_9GAMM